MAPLAAAFVLLLLVLVLTACSQPSPTPTPLSRPTPFLRLTPGSGPPLPPVPFPAVFSGRVFLNGQPAPDGTEVHAVMEGYESTSERVKSGWYQFLVVEPPSFGDEGKAIFFYTGRVKARESAVFRQRLFADDFDLHFEQ